LNPRAPRTMAILDPVKVVFLNVDDKFSETFEAPLFPSKPE